MLANRLAKYAALRGIYYCWVMAALAFFYVLFSSSALGITAVLIKPMSDQLGLTIGELSASQGLRFALFGLAAPFAGGLMLRYGPRRMVALSGVLSLLGLLLTSTMTTRFQLWLGFGALLGLAPGLTALQLSAVISSRWFTTHRGLVVGVLNGAIATGTLLFMPLGAWISEQWGWRAALVPSSIGLFVMMVLFVLLTKDRPQELGLAPLGEASMPPVPPRPTANFVLLSLKALRLGSEQLVFWVLAATFFICGLSSYGLTQTHFVPYCGDLGFPLVTSASLLAMIGVCDLIGTIGSGWLSDRYDNRWLLAIYDDRLYPGLWTGFHRNGASYGAVDRRGLRARNGTSGVWLDFCCTPARGWIYGGQCGRQPRCARNLRTGVPDCGRALHSCCGGIFAGAQTRGGTRVNCRKQLLARGPCRLQPRAQGSPPGRAQRDQPRL